MKPHFLLLHRLSQKNLVYIVSVGDNGVEVVCLRTRKVVEEQFYANISYQAIFKSFQIFYL